ncbi:gliding motility-associated C-terminal domain-containing protein [Hymenobacter sp. BT664]|uniref:Gliding motility-associated C-terminal domain-containing protein n=1 Tax=Hymenobacter montanus TaxID=2771359 RepID=A0A927BB70_9BACT|nr:gliding motility-associated C-terminal domain-containing protein [Hymenobacter montanus]MBD2767236.1 gliding motility-associated C-terminal domain-containing protein [Hymenobacter montanus]
MILSVGFGSGVVGQNLVKNGTFSIYRVSSDNPSSNPDEEPTSYEAAGVDNCPTNLVTLPPGSELGYFSSNSVYVGANQHPQDNGISIQCGIRSYAGGAALQQPFPGDSRYNVPASETWLYSNGNSTDAAFTFWQQTVNGLSPNTAYAFSLYTSNAIAPTTSFGVNPILELQVSDQAGTAFTTYASFQVWEDSDPLSGHEGTDLWDRRQAIFATAPGQTSAVLRVQDLAIGPYGDDLGIAAIGLRAVNSIAGTVFEDPNYGGGGGRPLNTSGTTPLGGATVELYNATTGALIGTTTTSTTPGSIGQYLFDTLPAGDYIVRVVSSTVSSARPGYVAGLLPIQTYNGTADRVGGEAPEKADAPANTGSQRLSDLNTPTTVAQSVAAVTVGATGASGVDFGFNFSTIVNANLDGQGSLRQFIANANALGDEASLVQSGTRRTATGGLQLLPAGKETSIFMVPNGGTTAAGTVRPGFRPYDGTAQGGPNSGLNSNGLVDIVSSAAFATISSPNTVVDGTTQTANIGNTNNVVLGTGGTVGVQDSVLVQLDGPEVQLRGARVGNGVEFSQTATTSAVRGLAIYGFNINVFASAGLNSQQVLIEGNVLGTPATSFTDPGAGVRTSYSNVMLQESANDVVRQNLIGFAGAAGVSVITGGTGHVVRNNEIRGNGLESARHGDGIEVNDRSDRITIVGNLFINNACEGIDTFNNDDLTWGGNNTLRNNTVSNNGVAGLEGQGIHIWSSNNATTLNRITGNRFNGVLVGTGATGNVFSQNSFAANGGLGLDLVPLGNYLGDGPTLNDLNDTDTGTNNFLNFPVLATVTIAGGNLMVRGFARPGALVELYAAAVDPTGFGEGQTYLFAATEGSAQDTDNTTGAYGPGAVNGLAQGRDNTNKFAFSVPLSSLTPAQQAAVTAAGARLTATATLGGNTSEFGGNVAVGALLTGVVFEDVNYGGSAGRSLAASAGVPRPGATVELYDNTGTFLSSTTTDAAGEYSFSVPAGTYTVRVVSGTVSSSRPGYIAGLLPVPTYNGSPDRVGGEAPEKADAPANTGSQRLSDLNTPTTVAQSVATVTAGAPGVDFGFNFSTIVNTNDAGQGSLRQFVLNSNALGGEANLAQSGSYTDLVTGATVPLPTGQETSIFMIPDGQAHPGLRAGVVNQLSAQGVAIIRPGSTLLLTGANAAVDGRTQTFNIGNTNNVVLGTGGTVGTNNTPISQLNGPEVQVQGNASGFAGLQSGAGASATSNGLLFAGLAVYGFQDDILLYGQSNTVTQMVVGTPATAFTDPGASSRTLRNNIGVTGSTNRLARVVGNLIGYAGIGGVYLDVNSSGLVVTGNEIIGAGAATDYGDALSLNGGDATVTGNFVHDNSGPCYDAYSSNGKAPHIITGNTFRGKGSAGNPAANESMNLRVMASGSVVRENIISGSVGPGILIGPQTQNVVISRNSMFDNGGLTGQVGIDLLTATDNLDKGTAPFVTLNDTGDGDAGANDLLNYPVITSAAVSNGQLELRGFARPGALIEFFHVGSTANSSGFGEGKTYLVSQTEGSADDTDSSTGAYTGLINGLNQGSDNTNKFSFSIPLATLSAAQQAALNACGAQLTATATLGGTSEFSGNVTISPAPVVIRVTDPVPVCAGATVRLSAGPRPGYLFTWYNGATIVNGGGAVLNDSVFVASVAGSYQVQLTAVGCAGVSTTSPAVAITVLPAINPGSIAAAQMLCAGDQPAPFTSVAPADGGTGTFSYQWESSPDNTTWTAISSATAADYAAGPVAATTYFRRQAISGSCTPVASNTVALTVSPVLTAGAIEADQTLCAGTTPAPLTSTTAPSGGTGTYTYQWESSPDNSAWTAISGALAADYAPAAITSTTYFRRRVTSGAGTCATAVSNVVTLTVVPAVTASTIGSDQTLCAGSTPDPLTSVVAATGGTGAYAYQWESSLDNTTWTAIAGATGATYALGPLTATTYFRQQVSSGGCVPVTSNTVTLSVTPGLTAGTIGRDQTLCAGATPEPLSSLTAPTGGTGTYAYQWESSADNTAWTSIVGATSADFAPGPVSATTYFRRQVTSGTGSCAIVASAPVVLTVLPTLLAGSVAADQTVCAGAVPAPLTDTGAPSGGTGTYAYQWESSLDNITWTAIAGATNAGFAPGPLAATTYFRRQVMSGTGSCSTAYANTVTITILPSLTPGSIAADQTLCVGATPAPFTGTSPSGGTGTYAYQWESSADNATWTAISGATAADYSAGPVSATTYFRRQVSSGSGSCAPVLSNIITITISPALAAGRIAADQQINSGTTPVPLTSTAPATGGTGSYTYQWESSADNTNFTAVVGATSPGYAPGALTQTTYYRRQVSSGTGTCATAVSNVVTITVVAPGVLTAGSIAADQTLCIGATPAPLTSTAPAAGGTGTYAYQWESSLDNVTFTAIAGATNPDYAPGPVSQTTYFRRQVTSGAGAGSTTYTAAVTITVSPALVAGRIAADQTLCAGATPAPLTSTAATGGTGTYTYQWESSLDNTSWTAISGATAADFAPGPVVATTYFRYQVSSGTCGAAVSNTVVLTVSPGLTAGTVGSDQTLCAGTLPAPLTSTTAPSGGTGTYAYQWELSTDNSTWTAINGAVAADYTPAAMTSTTYFRRQVSSGTGACATATSNTVTITITPALVAGRIAADQQINSGTAPVPLTSTTPATGGTGSYAYQWESSVDNATFSTLAGAISPDYAPGALTQTTYFRRQAVSGTGACATAVSNVVTITVVAPGVLTAGSIAADQTLCIGATPAPLTSTAPAAGGTGTYTYQWESSLDNVTFTAIAGATNPDYAPGPVSQTTYFRRQVISGTGTGSTAYTAAVTITISPALVAGRIAADQTLCAGATPAPLTSQAPAAGGTGTYTYQWESSADNATWTAIGGATAADFAPGAVASTTYFRRQVLSGTCAPAVSNTVVLTVSPDLTAGAIGSDQTLCAGTSPAPLTSTTAPTGGTGTYAYQWESSLDNATWTLIAGATSSGYSPGLLATTTYFRRQVSSGASCSATSNTVTISITPALVAGGIAANQQINSGSTPAPFTSTTAATGGTGTYAYQWESSLDNVTFTAIAGATVATYAPGPLTQTTYYRRQVASGTCLAAVSNVVTITVVAPGVLTAGSIAGDQTLCAGAAPAPLTSTAPATGGTGTYAYQWESSLDNVTFTAIAGATNPDYAPGPLTQTTYFRRQVTSGTGAGSTAYTAAVTINISPALVAGRIAADQALCAGATPAPFTSQAPATGGTGTYTYQWESSVDNTSWTAISGATAADFASGSVVATTYFRRQVSSGTCAPAVSNTVVLTVSPGLSAGTVGRDQSLCAGASPAPLTGTTAPSGGTGTYAYQWESSTDNSTWTAINGAVAADYAPAAMTSTTYFRRQVSSGTGNCATATSNTVTITITPALIAGRIAADQQINSGTAPVPLTSTAPATGGTGTYAYQWESSLDNVTFTAITGATAAMYAPGTLTQTTYYRRQVTSGTGTCARAVSNAVTITVVAPGVLTAGSIAADQTICSGATPAPLTSTAPAAGGTGTYTYQWESSLDNVTFTAIAGATNLDYAPGLLTQTTYFRRQVTSGTGAGSTAYTAAVTVTISPALVAGRIAADQTLCAGATPAPLTSQAPAAGGTGTYTYQWESSADNATWTAISGATGVDFAPGAVASTTYFRRQVSSGTCAPAVSNTVVLTVSPGLSAGTVGSDQTLCTGASPARLTGTAATGGTGTYAYQWESSTDNSTWTAINGAVAADYTPAAMTSTTYFRRKVSSGTGSCTTATSNTVTITITPALIAGRIAADQQINSGTTPVPLTSTAPATGGTGSYTYQWESSADNTNFTAVVGATSPGYAPGALTQTTYFRRQAVSGTGICSTAVSNVVTVTVVAPGVLTAGSIGADQTLCIGATPAPLTSTAPAAGGTGTYTYQWESSLDNVTFTAIAGATNLDYAPGPVSQTTYFRRQVTSGTGTGSTAYTAAVTITVSPVLVAGRIAADQTLCAGAIPAPFTSQAPAAGGTGTYTYQWESSADNATWTAISGATSPGYAPGSLAVTTYFRRLVTSGTGPCATAASQVVTISVLPAVAAGTIGADQTLCSNTTPAPLTNMSGASGGGGTYSYQWESSSDNTTWMAVSGASAATYAPGPLTQTTYFRRRVTSGTGACATAVSNVAILTVAPAQTASIALATPAPQCAGSALTLTPVLTNAGPAPTFRWFVNNVLAATTPTFTSATLANNDQVRVEMTPTPNACISGVPTAVVTVTITPAVEASVAIRALGAGGPACAGTVLSFDIDRATGAGPTPQYQWLLNGTAVPGSTGPTFSSATLRDNDRIRLQMTASASCARPAVVTSNELVISLRPDVLPTLSIVSSGPACKGSAASFSIAGSSNLGTAPAYQWRVDGVDVPGAQGVTFSSATLRDGQLVTLAVRTLTATCSQPVSVVSNAVPATFIAMVDVEAGPDKEIVEGESVVLEGTANGAYPVEWSPDRDLSFVGGNLLRPVVAPKKTTVYTLRANINGCQDESRVTVKVLPIIGIPDAFSPNGDGINDTWEIDRIGNFPGNTVQVYNRWGSQIFSTTNYGRTNEWNGTSQGQAMPVGTYYYVITLGNGKTYSGSLTIVY